MMQTASFIPRHYGNEAWLHNLHCRKASVYTIVTCMHPQNTPHVQQGLVPWVTFLVTSAGLLLETSFLAVPRNFVAPWVFINHAVQQSIYTEPRKLGFKCDMLIEWYSTSHVARKLTSIRKPDPPFTSCKNSRMILHLDGHITCTCNDYDMLYT